MNLEIVTQALETREFDFGRFELFRVGGHTLGIATYEPGWHWSEHIGRRTGEKLCPVEHLGFVVAGRAAVQMEDGREVVMKSGDFFAIPPNHDSWVVGDEHYVSVHVLGAGDYAQEGDR